MDQYGFLSAQSWVSERPELKTNPRSHNPTKNPIPKHLFRRPEGGETPLARTNPREHPDQAIEDEFYFI
jgi:hypothetical protein